MGWRGAFAVALWNGEQKSLTKPEEYDWQGLLQFVKAHTRLYKGGGISDGGGTLVACVAVFPTAGREPHCLRCLSKSACV